MTPCSIIKCLHFALNIELGDVLIALTVQRNGARADHYRSEKLNVPLESSIQLVLAPDSATVRLFFLNARTHTSGRKVLRFNDL